MRPALLLVLLPLLAGCASPDGPGGGTDARDSGQPGGGGCQPGETTLLEWTSDGAQPGETTFEVPAGAERLELDWTAPTAAAGSWSIVVLDPSGNAIFEETRGTGVVTGGSGVTLTGQNSARDITQPPPSGTYTLRYENDGRVEGAAVRALVAGCL
ncbi:MAG TPA: hypothetical protein VFH78_04545 [Candidatus Thermoplasmatota archaeon]|nr:hypothetical protein [Candidatus Thermoplasmatota archaeon]